MKNAAKNIRYIFSFLCAYLTGAYAFAQDANDTLPESAYQVNVPRHVVNIYSNFVPYILFGIVIALILYVSYRYWHDGSELTPNH